MEDIFVYDSIVDEQNEKRHEYFLCKKSLTQQNLSLFVRVASVTLLGIPYLNHVLRSLVTVFRGGPILHDDFVTQSDHFSDFALEISRVFSSDLSWPFFRF
jgi:hypothetical protein